MKEELEEWEEQERRLVQETKELEERRIRKATEEIQRILEKYGVELEGIAIIKATEIRISPKRS